MEKACVDCKYYAASSILGRGSCRRRAPMLASFTSTFPMVREDDWCGEIREGNEDQPDKSVPLLKGQCLTEGGDYGTD